MKALRIVAFAVVVLPYLGIQFIREIAVPAFAELCKSE